MIILKILLQPLQMELQKMVGIVVKHLSTECCYLFGGKMQKLIFRYKLVAQA